MTSGMLKVLVAGVLVGLAWLIPASAAPKEIRIIAQNFAPLQWNNNGVPDGYVTHFIEAAVAGVNEHYPVRVRSFEFLPWKRAMLLAETEPDVMFFSISRTPDREDRFQWLGEVSPYGQYLFQLSSRPGIPVETLTDLLDLDVKIGVQDGSNVQTYFATLGLDAKGRLIPVINYQQGIEMLYHGRIDLLPLTGFLAQASACRQGYDGRRLQPVVFIEALAKPLWAVFSKGTDPVLVEAFRSEMARLTENGLKGELTQRHRSAWLAQACQ